MVKIEDLTNVIKQYNLKPQDFVTGNTKRNPHRQIAEEEYNLDSSSPDGDNNSDNGEVNQILKQQEIKQNLKDGESRCDFAFQAHKDIIKSIQYIHSTDEPLIFTAGLDRMAYIWDLKQQQRGKLIQGYMFKKNYQWDFPLYKHDSKTQERQVKVQEHLREIRK